MCALLNFFVAMRAQKVAFVINAYGGVLGPVVKQVRKGDSHTNKIK
jgi:hypothetical protein